MQIENYSTAADALNVGQMAAMRFGGNIAIEFNSLLNEVRRHPNMDFSPSLTERLRSFASYCRKLLGG